MKQTSRKRVASLPCPLRAVEIVIVGLFGGKGSLFIETLRVQIHANCRIRRIYFSDRLYSEEELPPEFKLFLPVQNTGQ